MAKKISSTKSRHSSSANKKSGSKKAKSQKEKSTGSANKTKEVKESQKTSDTKKSRDLEKTKEDRGKISDDARDELKSSSKRDSKEENLKSALDSVADNNKKNTGENPAGEGKSAGEAGGEKTEAIMDRLESDPELSGSLQNMSAGEKKDLVNLLQQNYGDSTDSIKSSIMKLQGQNKMGNKDSMGKSLLHNLKNMQKQEYAEGLDGNKIFDQTLKNLANPDNIHQGRKGTCVPTTLEYKNAKEQPSEYARIVGGLTGKEIGRAHV